MIERAGSGCTTVSSGGKGSSIVPQPSSTTSVRVLSNRPSGFDTAPRPVRTSARVAMARGYWTNRQLSSKYVPQSVTGQGSSAALARHSSQVARHFLSHRLGQAIHPPQHRKPTRPKSRDREGCDAADHDRTHGAPPLRGQAGFEVAELVRRTDEHGAHGAHAPADVVGRLELYEQMTHVDAHHVGRTENDEREQRKHEARADAEDDRRDTEHSDAAEHPRADVSRHWPYGERDRAEPRADTGRGAQQAEAARSDGQDVARIDGEQCDRTSEEHCEQIERNRAEHDRLRTNESQTGQERPQFGWLACAGRLARASAHTNHQQGGYDRERKHA